ncbi:MAG: DASH complex subunit SPC34 [Treponema sp.]|nr:DASH complex subunit SPC34 [Treponema sp.]
MKRILMVAVIFLLVGVLYAQQSGAGALPNSAQTRQTAQQYSTQAKSNSSQFETDLETLNARNVSNKDLETFNRLKAEIDQLESRINAEKAKVQANLDTGAKAPKASLERIDRLIKQHQAKIEELDAFISGA